MDKATYKLADGSLLTVEYDTAAPCRVCGLPVTAASMGGTDVCPWCDSGVNRDGTYWSPQQASEFYRRGTVTAAR